MRQKTAKLFTNGGSQAVRLPAEFRFEGADEVFVRRDALTGEIILSPKPHGAGWETFFALRDQAGIAPDFLTVRPLNSPLQAHDPFDEDDGS